MRVKIGRLLNNSLVFTNFAYFGDIDGINSDEICIHFVGKNFYKIAKRHKSQIIPKNTLLLGNNDRVNLDLAVDDVIDIEVEQNFPIVNRFVVQLFDKSRNNKYSPNDDSLYIHAAESFLNNCAINSIVSVGFHYIHLFSSNYVQVKIEKILSNENETKYGLVTKDTKIYISGSNNELIATNEINEFENYGNNINISSINFEEIGVGGLGEEFKILVRNLFLTRIIPKDIYQKLGIIHTKGAILYGPPGCGKTRIAKQIGNVTGCKHIRVINGPELLNKYVGASEENVRECFERAKRDPKNLHMLIFDEFDSIACVRHGSEHTSVSDKIVGQLLTMIDGASEINNLILFGLTNRLDAIDPAILRPGRFGIHIKIDLPNEQGRYEILKIHCKGIIDNGIMDKNADLMMIANKTQNYTGAELESLVQITIQSVIGSKIDFNNISESIKKLKQEEIKITTEDFIISLQNIKPTFIDEQSDLSKKIVKELSNGNMLVVNNIVKDIEISLYSKIYCINGEPKSGKTSIVCTIASTVEYEVKYISSMDFLGKSNKNIISELQQIFLQVPTTLIIIDNIELIVQYVTINFFNFEIFNCMKTLLNNVYCPVIITTSHYDSLKKMLLFDSILERDVYKI